MHGGGEFLAAVFLRDDHPEEALVLDELPSVRRQVLIDLRRFPVVHHRAQLLGLVVEERLLLGRQLRPRHREQFSQSGRPEKRSPSHHTVPASIASCSVWDMAGSWPRYQARRGRETSKRRKGGAPSTTLQKTNSPASTEKASIANAPPARPAGNATAPAAIQIHPGEFR